MCGIFGVVAKKNTKLHYKSSFLMKKLFLLSESRGKEASGFAIINDDNIIVYKSPVPAKNLVKSKVYRENYNLKNLKKDYNFISVGHSRLVTNGYEHENINNQPFIKNGICTIHNGIIVNHDELKENFKSSEFISELDTEIIPTILKRNLDQGNSLFGALKDLYGKIEGMTSIALLFDNIQYLALATNNGSLYFVQSIDENCFMFASEFSILNKIISMKITNEHFHNYEIKKIHPNEFLFLNIETLELHIKSNFNHKETRLFKKTKNNKHLIDLSSEIELPINKSLNHYVKSVPKSFKEHIDSKLQLINGLKRCKKCILGESFPFIKFDDKGICNYCNDHKKIVYQGKEQLKNKVSQLKKNKLKNDCLVPLSGGRDSSYVLHYIVTELGMNPICFSYDWGMITDLARRNQSRMCGKLGVEHIYVSADIRKKRKNIGKNVSAWLKRPELGMVPIFMAGDKAYFYYSNQIQSQNNLAISIMGDNHLEKTIFKGAFSNVKNYQQGNMAHNVNIFTKLKLLKYYFKQYTLNPRYLNKSLIDTMKSYWFYYGIKHEHLNFFDFVNWDGDKIDKTLIHQYNWEIDPGTTTTWRIGDGTAAFYNYIYYNVAGFTENDTFRSNQIREGQISRSHALELIETENLPRWESIKWYCDTINIDFEHSISVINKIKTLY